MSLSCIHRTVQSKHLRYAVTERSGRSSRNQETPIQNRSVSTPEYTAPSAGGYLSANAQFRGEAGLSTRIFQVGTAARSWRTQRARNLTLRRSWPCSTCRHSTLLAFRIAALPAPTPLEGNQRENAAYDEYLCIRPTPFSGMQPPYFASAPSTFIRRARPREVAS